LIMQKLLGIVVLGLIIVVAPWTNLIKSVTLTRRSINA